MDVQEDTANDELITQFINITGAEEEIAKNLLEACNWDVQMATNMFVDSNMGASSSSSSSSSSNREPARPAPADDIRPPIPPVRQVLVEEFNSYPSFSYNSVFSGFGNQSSSVSGAAVPMRNFEQEAHYHQQQLLQQSGSSSQQEEPSGSSSAGTSTSNGNKKTFDDLFRPPVDMIFRGTFEMAKFTSENKNKWLMVNIQNHQEFSCQILNRDVWSNHAVKSIIKEDFIFWQCYNNQTEGQKFITFYNVTTFPYVCIIDPRTGEKLRSWTEIDTLTFCDYITRFLSEHPKPNLAIESSSEQPDEIESMSILEDSEEAQIEAAIKASLRDAESNALDSESIENDASDCKQTEDWRQYLGPEDSPKIEIIIRYPDGSRENATFHSTSLLKALFLYLNQKGFSMAEYDLISNFPKRNMSSLGDDCTLGKAGIHSRDTLYVQAKD